MTLNGRVALVTGCNGGIGRAICASLRSAGAYVVGGDIVEGANEGHRVHKLDVANESDWTTLIAEIERTHGALDILVHNAGIAVTERLECTSLADLRRVLAVNVEGPFIGTKASIDLMRRTGTMRPSGTSVIMISSIMGIVGGAFSAAYCASKGGVHMLAKAAAVEFASLKYPIRVNSVHPGPILTPMVEDIIERYVEMGVHPDLEAARRAMPKALGRATTAEDIAGMVRFLASDEAGHVTGTELVVDGGFTAR